MPPKNILRPANSFFGNMCVSPGSAGETAITAPTSAPIAVNVEAQLVVGSHLAVPIRPHHLNSGTLFTAMASMISDHARARITSPVDVDIVILLSHRRAIIGVLGRIVLARTGALEGSPTRSVSQSTAILRDCSEVVRRRMPGSLA